jgi:D-glycero-alpha-D-manno-heptose-7-phosphate kinase
VFEKLQDFSAIRARGNALEIPLAVLKKLNFKLPVDLFLASEIPPGAGLGSSASVCVNLLKAMNAYLHQPVSKYDLAEQAFFIARHVLGRNVGKQDGYASAFGGINYFIFCHDGTVTAEAINLEPLILRELQSHLMLFFTGAAHSSWSILKEQEASTRHRLGSTLDALHEVKALATEMREALAQNDLVRFGELLHLGWLAKRRISASCSCSVLPPFSPQ